MSRLLFSNSRDIASWRRSWNFKSSIVNRCIITRQAVLMPEFEYENILPVPFAPILNRDSFAFTESGTSRDVPFFVVGKWAIRLVKLTCSQRNDNISPCRMADSKANSKMDSSSWLSYFSQYRMIWLSSRGLSLRVRPGAGFGFLTFLTGLSSTTPHSIRAISKKFERRDISSLTVDGEIERPVFGFSCCNRSSLYCAIWCDRIERTRIFPSQAWHSDWIRYRSCS